MNKTRALRTPMAIQKYRGLVQTFCSLEHNGHVCRCWKDSTHDDLGPGDDDAGVDGPGDWGGGGRDAGKISRISGNSRRYVTAC